MRRAALLLALLAWAAPAAAAPPRTALRLEAGGEYDSNVHRAEEVDGEPSGVEGAPLLRLAGRGQVAWAAGRERLLLLTRLSGKLFSGEGAEREDVAVVAADASYDHRLAGRGVTLGGRARYYDALGRAEALETGDARTFRIGWGEGSVGLAGPGGHRLRADLGYGGFHFKPEPRFDWHGPGFALGWSTTAWRGNPDRDAEASSIELSAAYRIERRGYDDTARTSACPDGAAAATECFAPTRLERADLHHGVAVEAVWTGRQVLSARYELEVNDSNSFGESLVRQRLELGATFELTDQLYLTSELAILYNVFLDPLLVARDVQAQTFLTIEDENRNSLTALLTRRIGEGTAFEARYAIYSNEFATEELEFRRQTLYVGLVHEL